MISDYYHNYPFYVDNNVGQCWCCGNCIGKRLFEIKRGILVYLPECRAEDKFMNEVYDVPCRKLAGTEKIIILRGEHE